MPSRRRVRLSPEADDDFRDILQHSLTTWGAERRAVYAAALADAFQHLARFPNIGQWVGGPRPGARRYRVEQHVMYDDASDEEVRIARILHVRMDAPKPGNG